MLVLLDYVTAEKLTKDKVFPQQKYDFLYILLFVCVSFFSMQKHNDINNAYTRNSLTNWLHLQVNWTLSWWMNLNPRCISPCRFPTEPPFSRRTPLPCSGFHRPAPRPFSVQRLVSQKTHGQKACEKKELCSTTRWVYLLFIRSVYIFSIKMLRCWYMEEEGVALRFIAYKAIGNKLAYVLGWIS